MQEQLTVFQISALTVLITGVLFLPFIFKKIEEELEIFLLVMGLLAVTITQIWSGKLILEALKHPVPITAAVLFVGLIFRQFKNQISNALHWLVKKAGYKLSMFFIVFILGLTSSVITAIIAALIWAEVVTVLHLTRKAEIKLTVYACFAIGLGAVLTPLGEPLSTIVVAKLAGEPHNAGFLYLLKLLWIWVVPGVTFFALLAAFTKHEEALNPEEESMSHSGEETVKGITIRAGKVFLFVSALTFLGEGLKPLATMTVAKLSDNVLYWINSISAVLDNATLAAAEIVPQMPQDKIVFILMGLLISGGMLIPGNIPNIICASKLGIKSREWAKTGVPLGAAVMLIYFILLQFGVER